VIDLAAKNLGISVFIFSLASFANLEINSASSTSMVMVAFLLF
jgi:hypothetical protein